MKTIKQIIEEVKAVTGSYSEATFRRDAARFGVKPLTKLRFNPMPYPADSAARILAGRGFAPATLPPADTAAARIAKLPTMSELRSERKKARGGK